MAKFLSFLRYFFIGYVAFVFVAFILCAHDMNYPRKTVLDGYSVPVILIALVLVAAFVALMVFIEKHHKEKNKSAGGRNRAGSRHCADDRRHASDRHRAGDRHFRYGVFLAIAILLLLLAQALICHGALFATDWDIWWFRIYLLGDRGPDVAEYFSNYPNQRFIIFIFRVICTLFGGGAYGILALLAGSCVCVTISVACCSLVVRKVTGSDAWAVAAFIFAALFIGISPWIMIPYTDTYGMLCPSLVLLIYLYGRKGSLKTGLIVFFSLVGYLVKPTAIFILVAIVLVEIAQWLKDRAICKRRDSKQKPRASEQELNRRSFVKTWLSNLVALVIAGVVAFGMSTFANTRTGLAIDEEKAFGVAHYLYLGSNLASLGVWNAEDVLFAQSFDTKEERDAAEIQGWVDRVQTLGFDGIANLSIAKSFSNLGNGTFGWFGEGAFVSETYGKIPALLAYYGLDGNLDSDAYKQFLLNCQIIWFAVLIGVVASALRRARRIDLVLTLALLMLCGFLLIFECRSRYLILYLPYFAILAILGFKAIADKFLALWEKRSHSNYAS